MFDYETLRLVWWLLLGVLLTGFAVTDGFDLGAVILMPFVARSDKEKRIVINTVGPVWEGNQVWIILGAGAIFAAWPYVYAVTFSSLYLAMLLVLTGFILRPVSFKYRSKLTNTTWRKVWDALLTISGLIPAFLFGVALGNVVQGLPFYFDDTLRAFYEGHFWQLLNPFALFCGIGSTLLLVAHGGIYLAAKTENPIHDRTIMWARRAMMLFLAVFAIGGLWMAYGITGFKIAQVDPNGPSNPLHKEVITATGAWIKSGNIYWSILLGGFVFGALTVLSARAYRLAFVLSSLTIICGIATIGFSMYPFILPSTLSPKASLTVWDASSSYSTLVIMLVATLIFIPIILVYTGWVYHVLKGKITEALIDQEHSSY